MRRLTTLAAFFAVGTAVGVASVEARGWEAGVALWLARGTGWAALGALMLALCATPARRIASRVAPDHPGIRWIVPTRRAMGIAAAVLALTHAIVAFWGYLGGVWELLASWAYLRAGLVALLIMLALMATSFPRIVTRMRLRLWKPLHRLAYVAATLALVHLMLSPFAPRAVTLTLFTALIAAGLLRWLPAPAPKTAPAESPRPKSED